MNDGVAEQRVSNEIVLGGRRRAFLQCVLTEPDLHRLEALPGILKEQQRLAQLDLCGGVECS